MAFIRPENAVARAEELLRGDKPELAVSILLDTLHGRKYRSQPDLFKKVIQLHLSLCVNLRDSQKAKAGLLQYRNICQGAYADKLEDVMAGFLDMSERRTDEARKVLERYQKGKEDGDLEDLENIRPPGLLLSFASGDCEDISELLDEEGAGDPVAVYGAWLKFLWDAYRMCLDMLKNNNRVEHQYKNIALLCFKFAVRHKRKGEFRKICESIRQHLNNATRNLTNTTYGVKLDNPNTIRAYVETRLAQFDAALQLNMWQEAFRAVEDLHVLMAKVQICAFHPLQYVSYYWKASLVFWNAKHFAHHAQAIFHHFTIYRDHKKSATKADLAKLSTRLILAVLSIPSNNRERVLDGITDTDEGHADRQKQLYSLLNLSRPPSRESLLEDLKTINILQYSTGTKTGEILNKLMSSPSPDEIDEICFSGATTSTAPSLTSIEDDLWDLESGIPNYMLDQYKSHIHAEAVNDKLKECSQIYSTVELSRLKELCPKVQLNFVTNMCQSQLFDVIIDDVNCRVIFDKGFKSRASGANGDVQVSERENIRNRLRLTSIESSKIIEKILQNNKLKNPLEEKKAARRAEFVQLHLDADKYRLKAADRARATEKFKKIKEINTYKKKKSEMELRKQRQEKEIEMEEARKRERSEHRKKMEKAEEEKRERKKTKDLMMTMDMGRKFLAGKTDEELVNIDIPHLHFEQQQNDRKVEKERKAKLTRQAKKIDYFYRACHFVQLGEMKKKEEDFIEKMKVHWDKLYEDSAEKSMQAYQKSVERRDNIRKRLPAVEEAMHIITTRRKHDLDERTAQFNQEYEDLKKIVAEKRKEKRKMQRMAAYKAELKAKAEEEKRKADEKKYKPPHLKGDVQSVIPPPTQSPTVSAAPPPRSAGRFQNLRGSSGNTFPRRRWNNPPPSPNQRIPSRNVDNTAPPTNSRGSMYNSSKYHGGSGSYRQNKRWSPPRNVPPSNEQGRPRNPPTSSASTQWRQRTNNSTANDMNWRQR